MDPKYLNKLGANEYGKTKWNRLSDKEKQIKITTEMFKDINFDERLELTGFKSFMTNFLPLSIMHEFLMVFLLEG